VKRTVVEPCRMISEAVAEKYHLKVIDHNKKVMTDKLSKLKEVEDIKNNQLKKRQEELREIMSDMSNSSNNEKVYRWIGNKWVPLSL
jgi:hypothetical protein